MLTTVGGHWELQAAALLKAVWWDFLLADGRVIIIVIIISIMTSSLSLFVEEKNRYFSSFRA